MAAHSAMARLIGAAILWLAVLASCSIVSMQKALGADASAVASVTALIPALEPYITEGMRSYDLPGLSIGIIADDRLVYGKGFGLRSKAKAEPVDTQTLFQIGSTTKAFLAASIAVMVDRGKLHWDDRVVDLEPGFQLQDPWVTREFRLFDLLAQRSGLPEQVNDGLGMLGYPGAELIRSLRYVAPVSSFRSTFSYTNLTHLLAGRIVAQAAGAADWNAVLQQEFLAPLGMTNSSYTAAAMEASGNHAMGYRWTPGGTVEVPFTQLFPYDYFGAGDMNSNIDEMARWVRLQLGGGSFEGKRLVSAENLELTHQPKVAINDKMSYAMGWIAQQTANGRIVWHNGGTIGFGAYVGLLPDKNIGVVVLTNEVNVGLPDAIGLWTLDRLLGNPNVDYVANRHKAAVEASDTQARFFARPAAARAAPPTEAFSGDFSNPAFGEVSVAFPVMTFKATGAMLRLEPRDGGIFTANFVPAGRFAALAEGLGPLPLGFVQLQMDGEARQNLLRLTFSDQQSYTFTRQ